MEQALFSMRRRNPDVLTCIANLSNDEVFTPPEFANSEHSIAKSFDNEDGDIWFERLEHTWEGNKCKFCGAPKAMLELTPSLRTAHTRLFTATRSKTGSPSYLEKT
jgi:hypothetical protein